MLNPFERAAIQAYRRGQYTHLFEAADKPTFDAALDDCGDALLAFILRDLSTEEDCDTLDAAINRMTTAQADLTTVLQALRRTPCPPSANPEHNVTWTIDINADTPREAARQALDIQRDPFSTATMFTVYEHRTGQTHQIDLENDDG